jgi:hypothetical protein
MNPDPYAPGPLIPNPFAVLGLPAWPDLDDETVDAAWRAIAAETHPDRPDGGNLARYTQATAAYFELHSPWGRTEAFADLLDAAWAQGRYDAYPGHYPPGHYPPGHDPGDPCDPADDLPPPSPWETELGPIPLDETLHQLAQIPARFRRGHPVHLAIRATVIAGLCLTVLTVFPAAPGPASLSRRSSGTSCCPPPGRTWHPPTGRPAGCRRPGRDDASGGPRAPGWPPGPAPGCGPVAGWGPGGLSIPLPQAPEMVAYRGAPLKVVLPAGSSTLTSAARHAMAGGGRR